MAKIDVIMPQMGESIAEGTLSKWLKQVGDVVKRDEPMFEISTDKVDAEIPAPNGGVLAEILARRARRPSSRAATSRVSSGTAQASRGQGASTTSAGAQGSSRTGTGRSGTGCHGTNRGLHAPT